MLSDTKALVKSLGSKFIQRKDVKAFQRDDGAWFPVREPMTMQDFADHFSGAKTMGHYLLDQQGYCKLFAYDIDLVKHARSCDPQVTVCKGCAVTFPNLTSDINGEIHDGPETFSVIPREAWNDPTSPALETLTLHMRCMAEGLALHINKELQIPVAIATSGNKGLHVYGFTGTMPADTIREVATNVLASFGGVFEPFRGQNFWRHKFAYEVLDIEVFPKQSSLDGKDLGNLMSLPLGIHRVTGKRKEFLTTKVGYNRLVAMDAEDALDGDLPWE